MIVCNDVLKWADEYGGEAFHALLADPPYELGFMGKDWDRSGIAFKSDTWAALAEHLHPGAFGMAFASSRGWHRLAVAIEDAGLRIHPSIFGWAYGSGFPKATRIDTQIDAAAGAKRDVVRTQSQSGAKFGLVAELMDNKGYNDPERKSFDVTAPASDLARAWEGHRYGLQALKPALEPIIVFQKPYEGKPVDSIVSTGAGALNIDGARIGTNDKARFPTGYDRSQQATYSKYPSITDDPHPQGRWPANFTLSHSPGCVRKGMREVGSGEDKLNNGDSLTPSNDGYCRPRASMYTHKRDGKLRAYGTESVADWECTDECPVRRLGEQSGERLGSASPRTNQGKGNPCYGDYESVTTQNDAWGDKGTCARFYHNADWSLDITERLGNADPVRYCAKASRRERDAGLEEFAEQQGHSAHGDYQGTPEHATNTKGTFYNNHATVKPLTLVKWLSALLLPPPEYAPRRILVPFAGVMSEAIGCLLAGWEEIVAIEMSKEYCEIGKARIKWWAGWSEQISSTEPKELLELAKQSAKKSNSKQERLL